MFRIRSQAFPSLASILVLAVAIFASASPPSIPAAPAEDDAVRHLAPGAASPPAAISELDWLAGAWEGEGLGGHCQEVWLPAAGGTMAGTFKLVKDGEVVFYELLTIVESEGSLVMRLKHFHADLTAWEEKSETVDFPLVELGDRTAYFDGLTIVRRGDRLDLKLALHGEDGTRRIEPFAFRKLE